MDEQAQLSELLHLMGELRRAAHRSFTYTVTDCQKHHFPMLERVYFSIEKHGEDGAVSISDLTRLWRAAPSAISRDLRILERQGYILRTPDPQDRRKTLVRMTPSGTSAHQRCHRALHLYLHGVLDRMGEENVLRIAGDMRLTIDAINAECDARTGRDKPADSDFEGGTPLC